MLKHALACTVFAACTSSSSPATTESVDVTGTLGGQPVAFKAAVSKVAATGKGTALFVALSPFDDPCTAPSLTMAGATAIELAIYKTDASSGQLIADTDATTYTTDVTTAGPWVEIDVIDRDSSCMPTDSDGKGDGTVQLDSANATGFDGTFSFTTGSDHLEGSFSTKTCPFVDMPFCA